ncbi:MAG TPA: histidine phosphatase family protein [Steroidobacteraceae bacterium]|nr:histidine phosphatase family protein [Steroidobacteraceae bacterium]
MNSPEMQTVVFSRHRHRPFLAPIWLTALLVAVIVAAAVLLYQSAQTTTVVVVRPGERPLGSIADPPLVIEGERRAERLAHLFGATASPGRITAIYVSAARRARQTAAPLAARLGLRPIVFDDGDPGSIAGRALSEHRGETVMIVDSGSTVSQLVEALSGVRPTPVAEREYGSIYIVSVPILGSAGVLQLHY